LQLSSEIFIVVKNVFSHRGRVALLAKKRLKHERGALLKQPLKTKKTGETYAFEVEQCVQQGASVVCCTAVSSNELERDS